MLVKPVELKQYIETAIKNIEQNLSGKVNVEKLSSECFISPRQLYRDFYSHTGHSVNEYIRKRKLSKALGLLKYSEISFSEVAYSCGYSSAQALCRSIKSSLGLTPTEYRNGADIYYFPLYRGVTARKITVKSITIPETIKVIFSHTKLTGIEQMAVDCLFSALPGYSGRLFGRNGEESGNRFCYELYIEYDESYITNLSSSFKDISICRGYSSLFACVSTANDGSEINAAWDFMYGHWLKGSMFGQNNIPYFEEYIIKDNNIKRLILYLPVKSRENFYKINIKPFEERTYITASMKGSNAEKSASAAVVDFIAGNYPHLFRTQKEFYISRNNSSCICGINIDGSLHIPDGGSIQKLTIPNGLYAVLEGCCYGSGNENEQVLLDWLRDNGFDVLGTPFSIYDTSKGTGKNEIVVKSQAMIKDGRIR